MRLVAILFLAFVAAALLTYVRPSAPPGVPATDRATFQVTDSGGLATGAEGEAVTLPHRCPPKSGTPGCFGSYRTSFHYHPEPSQSAAGNEPPEPWSIYIPTYAGRAVIKVNGEFLVDSRRLKSDAVLVQAGPLLTPIPAPLLHEGENRLEIQIGAWSRVGGFLDVVFIGPDTALRTVHRARELMLETLPRLLVAWQAALGLAMLIVWIGHREQSIHLIMSLLMGLGWIQGIPLLAPDSDLANWIGRTLNFAGLWQATFLPLVISRLFGQPLPIPQRWMFVPPTVVTATFLLTRIDPVTWQPYFLPVWIAVAAPWVVSISVWSIWVTLEASFKKKDTAAQLVLAAYMLAMIMSIHDILAFTGIMKDSFPLLSRFLPPLVTTTISAILMWRFAMALGDVSRFNSVLRQEVEAAEAALRASFEREQAQNRIVALEEERRRLTRDLHDGLAGQLVSIVAQCELPTRDYGRISKAARLALDDLRLVIASMDDVGNDLAMMLAVFHERIGPQLHAQGVELTWRMVSLPEIEGLRSEHALALFRILQEAVTNAIRHSGSRSITIGMLPSERPGYAVRIVVADPGRGGTPETPMDNPTSGRGLRNMRERAASLGAAFEIDSTAEGTRVVLDLPRNLPGSPKN